MSRNGYNGKILKVDLTDRKWEVDEREDLFYRKYPGGSALGMFYLLDEMPAGTDALAPESLLVLAPSVLTGAPVSGASRFTVTCRSPLGGTAGDSQCGGQWGPELKFAGFDAVVVTGKASSPVYISISSGDVDIIDAASIWGRPTADTRAAIREELGDEKVKIACIGPGGEKLVRFACISGGSSHYAGRTGAGAVMGSKNLKAVACRGKRPYEYDDKDAVLSYGRLAKERRDNSGFAKILRALGTAGVVKPQYDSGNLTTRNFTYNSFEGVEKLSGETMRDSIVAKSETCFGCVVSCKKIVKADKPYTVDPAYGGPEFETIALLGSNLMIDDITAVAKANELCNAFGIDTISTGAMIAYAMESFENGIITEEQTGGLKLRFGDADAALRAVEMIGARDGFGDVLAEGMFAAIEEFGAETAPFAIHAKGNPFPGHMAQVKKSQALAYAVNPFGADHMSSEHDWLITAPNDAALGLGLYETREAAALDTEKARMVAMTQMYYSLLDTLTLCAFCWGPDALFNYYDLEGFVRAVTGWNMSFWELMKVGERRVNMMRAFNAREGFTADDDILPDRVFEPMPKGTGKGICVRREDFEAAKRDYYGIMGWDPESGNPTRGKLCELGLDWLCAK